MSRPLVRDPEKPDCHFGGIGGNKRKVGLRMFDFGNSPCETPFCVTSAVMNPGFTSRCKFKYEILRPD